MDKMIYYMTLDLFLKKNNRDPKDNENNNDLFPNDWHSIDDYQLKAEILNEAIDKGISVAETNKYNVYIEKESIKLR